MSLSSDSIERVRAFELPVGVGAKGGSFDAPRVALVKFKSDRLDELHQVYVNGQFAGTTTSPRQRQMIVQLPGCHKTAATIEVFAVDAEDAERDFSDGLDRSGLSGRVAIIVLRNQNLAAGATLQFYFDNGTGEIDYETPLDDEPTELWPSAYDKAGFGMSEFGESDFGYDSAGAVGFGRGLFGQGQFGLDADAVE